MEQCKQAIEGAISGKFDQAVLEVRVDGGMTRGSQSADLAQRPIAVEGAGPAQVVAGINGAERGTAKVDGVADVSQGAPPPAPVKKNAEGIKSVEGESSKAASKAREVADDGVSSGGKTAHAVQGIAAVQKADDAMGGQHSDTGQSSPSGGVVVPAQNPHTSSIKFGEGDSDRAAVKTDGVDVGKSANPTESTEKKADKAGTDGQNTNPPDAEEGLDQGAPKVAAVVNNGVASTVQHVDAIQNTDEVKTAAERQSTNPTPGAVRAEAVVPPENGDEVKGAEGGPDAAVVKVDEAADLDRGRSSKPAEGADFAQKDGGIKIAEGVPKAATSRATGPVRNAGEIKGTGEEPGKAEADVPASNGLDGGVRSAEEPKSIDAVQNAAAVDSDPETSKPSKSVKSAKGGPSEEGISNPDRA